MRWNGFLISIALTVAASSVAPLHAANFGTVVPIAGHSSDIALDESRGVLYIANFTANRIEVMSTADGTIRTSMNVAPQPGAISLSPDNQYLIVAHFGNFASGQSAQNAITLIHLADNTRQTFAMGDTPLGVQFVADGRAFIVTNNSMILFDPATGAMTVVATFATIAKSLPVTAATFPSQVILASLATSPDRRYVYGVADDGSSQAFYRFDDSTGSIYAIGVVASPKPLPRVSVSADGSFAMIGQYKLGQYANDLAQFPNSVTSANVGGNAVDSQSGTIYAQILTATSTTSSSSSSTSATSAPSTASPVLYVLDADNLTVRQQLRLPENMTGRAVLTSANDVLYTVSDSGVMILPVGSLSKYHRVTANQTDLVAAGSFCNRQVITQTLNITDPGGNKTDFYLSSNISGVTFSPSSGTTPATVQVSIDPSAFQSQTGTVTGTLTISSASAVNVPPPVRLLVNNRNPDQRGTAVTVSGTLTDILADPVRSRFYVLRQDMNQVLVYDGTNYSLLATLRTSTTPTQMTMTFDRQYLIVGHDNSQYAYVYNLDTFQQQVPIKFPSGHYPRQIAESGKALLALVRDVAGDAPGAIDRIDFAARTATEMPTLGIYKNSVNPSAVLAPAPNGGSILLASPDGNVMLYDANADSFTVSRQDVTSLSGPYAASSYGTYVVGSYLLNSSLVPRATLETASGATAGFTFVDQWGMRTTVPAAASPGVIQHVDPTVSLSENPTHMVEAPLAGTAATTPLMRTLAPLADRSAVISLSVSGFTVLPWNYDAAVAAPSIAAVVNAADGTLPIAPGGLISVYGQQMSPVNMATNQIPLPTALGESCLTVNGVPIPMIFVSPSQINGQLPFNVDGNATMTLHTPGGTSDNFYLNILPAAPSIFRSGAAGPETGLATVVRADNNQLVTATNPVHPNDTVVIYATGLGRTSPSVATGQAAPSDPLSSANISPTVTLGGMNLTVLYAGLVPGEVGVYQINAVVPGGVPQGMSIPLVISQSGSSTTLNLRVVK